MIELANENKKQERIDIIREALKEKAPLTYSELETSGQFQSFLEGHEAKMMVSFNEAQNKVWEKTMASFPDFFDPSYDETSSPM